MNWSGVMPAMTTAFNPDLSVDHSAVARHAQWLIENGCAGIICLGSLGEASTLSFEEKIGNSENCRCGAGRQGAGGRGDLCALNG